MSLFSIKYCKHLFFLSVISVIVSSCSDSVVEQFYDEESFEDIFFSKDNAKTLTRGFVDSDNILLDSIIYKLSHQKDIGSKVRKFVNEYGMPLWNECVISEGVNETRLFVPITKPADDEIKSIWYFELSDGRITNSIHSRDELNLNPNHTWAFDYFTVQIKNILPKSRMMFKGITRSAMPECVDSYAEVYYEGKLISIYTGTHCWSREDLGDEELEDWNDSGFGDLVKF